MKGTSASLRVVLVGAAGRLGRAVSEELVRAGHHVVELTRSDLDVTDPAATGQVILRTSPQLVINCTAYNAVDAAETDPAMAYAVNALAPESLARAAAISGALFVHYSTDFVFDGESPTPYSEDDRVSPVNAYGSSKLAGEVTVRRCNERHYILRVASLFGGVGLRGHRATVDSIAETLIAGRTVRALVDRTVSPSHVRDVAGATRALVEGAAPYGTYHCVSSGATTWFDLAHHVAACLSLPPSIERLTVAELSTVARRPQYCALSNEKLRGVGIEIPDWQSTIARHLSHAT